MTQTIALMTIVVRDYDEAVSYYTNMLGFTLVEDSAMGAGKRWVVVRPLGAKESGLLLAQAANDRQQQAIGRQAGGRVLLFLHTDDFRRDHSAYVQRGVIFIEPPRHEVYGTVAVFADLYGNLWDLIEPKLNSSPP